SAFRPSSTSTRRSTSPTPLPPRSTRTALLAQPLRPRVTNPASASRAPRNNGTQDGNVPFPRTPLDAERGFLFFERTVRAPLPPIAGLARPVAAAALHCAFALRTGDRRLRAMQVVFSVEDVIAIVEPIGRRGATAHSITGIASLTSAEPGDLSFLGNPKYKPDVARTKASVVLVPPDLDAAPATDQLFLVVDKPSVALARICARIEQKIWPRPAAGIHPSAVVHPGALVASSATVGPLCVVEAGARIGERVHLEAQVFVGREAIIGDDCWLMP